MPPAFALSQDQTLRFIQASPQRPKSPQQHLNELPKAHHSHQTILSQPQTTKHQAIKPRTNTLKGTSAQAPTAHPTPPLIATRQNTQQQSPAPNHPKIAKHYQLPKKPDAIVKQQKKNQQQNALRHPTSPAPSTTPIIGRAKTLANQQQPVKPKNTNNLAVNGLLVPPAEHVKRGSLRRQRPAGIR